MHDFYQSTWEAVDGLSQGGTVWYTYKVPGKGYIGMPHLQGNN